MPRLFISYRRDDAAGDAGRLADHLYRRFGADRVFLDIDTIEPGRDFVRVLENSLQQTAAVLVVIGRQWAGIRGVDGTKRLDNPLDYVRLEVEKALGRDIPVVPVLVQGAPMPRASELPDSLEPLTKRQSFVLDHTEFHADAERLCERLAGVMDPAGPPRPSVAAQLRSWWPAVALALVAMMLLAVYAVRRAGPDGPAAPVQGNADALDAATQSLLAEASAQARRQQYIEALATLAQARQQAPESPAVREQQEDVAMAWVRNVRFESGSMTYAEALKPALSVIDASLASATGARRADLLAHTGLASFMLWRDGNRELKPEDYYREALAIEPANPYANAMLAHWELYNGDDVTKAVGLFEKALQSGRAVEAVRDLQWATYGNSSSPEADVERVRVADAIRRDGRSLTTRQAQALWNPYFLALNAQRDTYRTRLLSALPPDEYIALLPWAFDDYVRDNPARQQTLRYYLALLHAKAGRGDQAAAELRALEQELLKSPGSLLDAVRRGLAQTQRH